MTLDIEHFQVACHFKFMSEFDYLQYTITRPQEDLYIHSTYYAIF